VTRAIPETPAPQDRKVRPDPLVQPEPLAPKARRVKLVLRDPQVPRAQLVLKVRKV